MNEELEGLVSLGIERGRDFNYIASVLADEGYSKEEIATAQKLYSQKKKSQTEPTPGSKPQAASTESQLAGPRLSQSPSASGTGGPDGKPYSELVSQAGALGALQYATTGVAPVSNKRKKEIVADISNLSSDLASQEKASAQLYLAKKEQGIEPSSDSEFVSAKQRENDLKKQKGALGAELFPESADALVVQGPDGNYQETELFKAKYEPVAIATLPSIVDDFEREKIAAEKARLRAENKEDYYDILTFGHIPILSELGDVSLSAASGFTGMFADAVDFVTRFGAQTEGEYEGILGETIGAINDSAKSWSAAMREQRGIAMDNLGISEEAQNKFALSLLVDGNIKEGLPSLAVMVADAWLFSAAAGSLAGVGSVSGGVVGAELESAILTGSNATSGFGLAARQVSSNLQRNVAESPVMFGAIATTSAQSSWDAVKDDESLSLTEKVALSTLSTFANTLTEGLNVDDLRLAAGSLNLDGAAREEALKSFSGTFKTYLKDMVQVGVPEAFEEGLNYYTEALGNYIVKGELPTAVEPTQAMLIGFLAPSLNVTAVYSKPMLEVALKNTVMMLPSTKRFMAEQELAKKRADIVDALADENIAESEKKVLQNALDDVDVAIAQEKKKDYEFYSSFEYADANEIVNISGQIKTKAQQWKKSRSKETRAILEAEIRDLYNQKLEIEKKYDSQAQAGVPSGVQKGAAPKQGEPVKSRGEETLETSGVLQTPEVEKAETTPQEEEARKSASKDASETFEVAGIVPGKVISQQLATTLNKVFQSVRTVVKGGKVKLHYTQESIANANAQTRATKAKNPNVFFDGFFDKSTNEFHVYIPTGGDVSRVVKVNENTYAVVDPKNGQTVKTFKDSQTAFRYKDAYDKAYIDYAVGKARHEAIHPVIDVLIEDTVDANGNAVPSPHRTFLYDSIIELYEANPAVKDLFDNFIDAYVKTGADKKTIEREVITEFLARMADEKTFKSLDKGFIQKVKDFVNEMLVRAGVKGITISTDDDLYRVARAFKMSMNLGKELRIAEGKGRNYTPVGDPFKVDILERLPKSNITQKKLESVISKGRFGILTTENPRGTRFPEEVNKRRQEAGKKWLEDRGYSPIEVVGKFEGIAENSLFVPNLTVLDANDFALEFSQEGIAHSSAFINNDGSYSPRNLESNQFNIDYNKTSNDYFSTIKLSDGTLSSFKMDYRWDIKMNQRAVFDGLTNPLDFAIQLKDDEQTFAQFFDSVGDSTMRDQAVLLQLLAEKFGFDKNIVFSSDNNNPIGIYEDSLIVNLSTLQSAKDSFGTFATAISLFISKENMGLYQSMLNEIVRENSDEFKEALEEAKGYEFAFETSTYEEDSFDAYTKGMAAKQVLESRIAEYFTTAKTDFEEIKQMWDNTQSMLGKAFNVEFKDLYPAMKIDQVMGMMASPTINPIGGAFIKELFENQVKYGGEKELGFDVLSSLDPRVSTLFTSPSIDVIHPVFVNDEFISFFEDAIDGLNSDDNYLSKMADYIESQKVKQNDLYDSRYYWLQAYDALEYSNRAFSNLFEYAERTIKDILDDFHRRGTKSGTGNIAAIGAVGFLGAKWSKLVEESIFEVILNNELEKNYTNILVDVVSKLFDENTKYPDYVGITGGLHLSSTLNDFQDFISQPENESSYFEGEASRTQIRAINSLLESFNEFEQYYNEFKEHTQGIENHKYALLIPNFNDKFGIQSIASNQGFKDLLDIEETVVKPQQADNRTLSGLQQAFDSASRDGYSTDEKQELLLAYIGSILVDRSIYGLRIPSPSGKAYFLVTDTESGTGSSISNTRIMESGKYRMVGQAIVAEASPLINWLEGNKKVKKISTKTGEKITGRNITIDIPKLNDTYVVSGSLQDNRVNVAFQSITTGYDLKDPGAALSVMPKVIEAVSQLFPEADVKFITFSALRATTDKRSGNELRTGTYQFTAKRLFRDFYMEANNSYGDQVIAIPTAFTGPMMQSNAFYDAMINKQNKEPDISFAIRTVESIPVEVSEGLNTINNAVAFAAASSFPNKIIFKEELQKRFKMYEKELKKKYGIKSFEVGGRGKKAIDEGLKRYLVDAYTYETLVAIEAYPDALGWYDYKTRAAMEIMSLIHPELNTDKNAADAFKIALAITSNGNKVAANFEEADRQYEYYKKNGKFDSNTSIGTQSAGIKSTFKMVNTVLERMSMEEFSSFLTSKFRAGDLKYIKRGKSESLLSGFTVDTEVYGAAIFGPKVGNGFYMNLNGEFDQLTMDRWFMRQFGRLTGTLIKRDPANLTAGKTRLKSAISALSTKDKAVLGKVIPGFGKMTLDEKANAINKASIDAAKRAEISTTKELNEVRLAGNNYSKNLSGEVEAPSGGNQRSFIINVFNEVQKELKDKYGIDITIADLQAVNWYPEKALYQTFQEGRDEDFGATETSDNEQPDYENAAIGLALKRGVTNEQINNARRATERGERAAELNRQRASLIGRDNKKASAEEVRRRILSVKAGEEQPVDFAMSLGGPKIEIDGKKVRQFAERMADSNIQLYSDIINNPENYYTPQKLEEIQDRLTVMTIPELLDEMTSDRVLSLSSEVKVDLFDEDNVSVLIGAELIKRYTAEGNDAKLLETIERMAKMGTTVGRMLRHFGEIKNTTHAGIASAVVAMAARAGRTLNEVQLKRLNDLALALFNKQLEAKNLMLEAIHSPSKANDEAIKKTEKELSIATKQLDDFISTVIPKKYSDLFGAIMQGNLLTPISQVFNIWGNVANTFTRQFLVNPPAALIDAIRAFASGKEREVRPSIGAFLFGLKRAAFMGVPESFRYMFTGRKPSDELFEYEYRRGFIPLQAMVAALSDTRVANAINKAAGREVIAPNQLARLENGEISVSDRVKKFTEATFGIPAEVMFRTLTLGDRPFSRFAEGVEIYRQARRLGLQGDAFANFLKHPDPSTIKKAKEAGREITYQADTSFSKGVQTILGALSKTELGAFIVRIIVPFSKTPSNIIYDTLNYVAPPVALARALKAAKKKDYKEFDALLAKSVIGFSIYAMADFLISLGVVSAGIGDDEKKEKEMKYSLFPYDSINLSALRRIMDGGTAELQDGDVFINYSKAGPIGAIIGARASYWAGKGLKPTSIEAVSDEYGEMFTQYLSDMLGTTMSSFQFMAQQSFLANTNQILELLTSKGEIKPDYVLTSLFKTTSAVVLPNTLTALNRSIRTKLPDLYDKNSLYNSLLNVIKDRTFNTDGVAVKVNIFGERIDQTPAGADPILYNLFDPMKYQAKEYEPYQQEVYRLYEELGQETGAIPTIPSALNSRKFTDKETNEQYYFTNEEVNNMLESLGKERQVLMKDLINQDWYKEYTDEDKLTEFEYIYKTTSKDGAWKEMYDKYVEKAKQENRLAR